MRRPASAFLGTGGSWAGRWGCGRGGGGGFWIWCFGYEGVYNRILDRNQKTKTFLQNGLLPSNCSALLQSLVGPAIPLNERVTIATHLLRSSLHRILVSLNFGQDPTSCTYQLAETAASIL